STTRRRPKSSARRTQRRSPRTSARHQPSPRQEASDMKTPAAIIARLAAACAVLAIVGCTSSESTQQWVATEKAKKGAPLQPLPVIKTFESFLYTDQDLRDPFGY